MCLAVVVSARLCVYVYAFMRACLSVYILSQTVKICLKVLHFCTRMCVRMFGHSRVFGYSRCMWMYDRSNAAHTLSTKHGGRRGQICNNCAYAYLMDTCVALQQCMCVVSYILILSPTECKWIHSGLVHKRVRSWMCVVSCTYIATKGVCIMHVRVQLDRR